ncbi:mechanosensitive ion channel family protein [Croceiramulus getboli]|nr:mechanosensitive ion channel family protein [Flavobacteriaceae bacterium YJPT1-3]
MDTWRSFQTWWENHPNAVQAVKYALWVLLIILLITRIRKLLKRTIPAIQTRYKSQKAVEIFGYLLVILLSLAYFTGSIKDFTLAIGLFSAGVAITLQELFLSIAGSLYIFAAKVYAPGDRIEMHGIQGDVIDIDSIYTTLMEIGEWVSTDNYSGRIVKLSNAFVFRGPIYNYSRDFPFIWDEFNLPIRHGSDVEMTQQIIMKIAQEELSAFAMQSKQSWQEVVKKYYIENAEVEPTLALTITDNWLQFNLRYIVDFKKRRLTKHRLHERLERAIEATNGNVQTASTTLEIVRIPLTNEKPKA